MVIIPSAILHLSHRGKKINRGKKNLESMLTFSYDKLLNIY